MFAVEWRLTMAVFTHAETPAQLPDVPVLVDDAVVVVVVDAEEPETGHVLPRTVSIHDDVASGY
jgi:hypothetical protein